MSDTKIVGQEVTVSFKDREIVPSSYVFEMDDRVDVDQTQYGVVRIRKYPGPSFALSGLFGPSYQTDSGITLVVTEGVLEATNEVRIKEVFGSAIINGDSSFNLQYPVVSGLSFHLEGRAYDRYGNEQSLAIGYDSNTNSLIFSRSCYCRIQYSYNTSYQIFRYQPSIFNDFEIYYMPDPNDYGQLLGFVRTPIGQEPSAPIMFAIQPPESIAEEFELYRIESTAYAKEDGLWEQPNGWPDSGTYPNSIETLDSGDSILEISRTHEIGYFSLLNSPVRAQSTQSAKIDSLPLDFNKELKLENSVAGALRNQRKEHFEKYRRLLNRAPKMRTTHYDVPIAEPYRSDTEVNDAREVARNIYVTVHADGSGAQQKVTVVQQALLDYRVKLTVKVPSRPAISASILRSRSNDDATDYNIQAQRINTMLSLIWDGIDWAQLRKRILASYTPDVYSITFDSSFPSN